MSLALKRKPLIVRKAQPDESSVYVSPELGNLLAGFLSDPADFVAPRIFPAVPVAQKTGKYKKFKRSFLSRNGMKKRVSGARSAEGGFEFEEADFTCEAWSEHVKFGKEERANAKKIDLDRAAMDFLAQQAMLSLEVEFFDTYFTSGIWTDFTGTVAAPDEDANEFLSWADADATPIADLKRAMRVGKKTGGMRFNKAVMSEDVWEKFSEHPNVVSRVGNGQTPGGPSEITLEQVAKLLRIDELIVAGAVETTSVEGASSDAYDYVAGSGVLLCHVTPTPMINKPSAGYRFHWTDYLDGAANEFGAASKTWYEEGPDARFYEVSQARDIHQVASGLGLFMATPLITT